MGKRGQAIVAGDTSRKKRKLEKKERRKKNKAELGDEAPKKVTRTLENTREFDETIVKPDDEEVLQDEATDEFASFFNGEAPKLAITTCKSPSRVTHSTT